MFKMVNLLQQFFSNWNVLMCFSVCVSSMRTFFFVIFCFHFTKLKMYVQCMPDHLKIAVWTQGFYLCYNCFNIESSPK